MSGSAYRRKDGVIVCPLSALTLLKSQGAAPSDNNAANKVIEDR